MNDIATTEKLTAKDFTSDQEVRWCPGCGDYAILKGVRASLANMGVKRENTVFVSGIGCAARFPYYLSTYGFHTIHGRAAAIATGVKLANPELDIWVVSGDGDGLSIGGNHMLHLLRRNVDVQVLLFNNEIYGLTKGQYSPTSKMGTRSPSTPMGSVDNPLNAGSFALGSGARFVARTVDTLQKHMPGVLARAHEHKGASFVEIFQNCIVYNDGVFKHFTDKSIAAEMQVHVEHGKPLVFGKDDEKGLRMKAGLAELEVVTIGENSVTEADVLIHDEANKMLAMMLTSMDPPHFPVALGVIYCNPSTNYDQAVYDQIGIARDKGDEADMNTLLRQGHTWTV